MWQGCRRKQFARLPLFQLSPSPLAHAIFEHPPSSPPSICCCLPIPVILTHLPPQVICYGMSINIVEVTWKSKLKLAFPNPNDYSEFMGAFSS